MIETNALPDTLNRHQDKKLQYIWNPETDMPLRYKTLMGFRSRFTNWFDFSTFLVVFESKLRLLETYESESAKNVIFIICPTFLLRGGEDVLKDELRQKFARFHPIRQVVLGLTFFAIFSATTLLKLLRLRC